MKRSKKPVKYQGFALEITLIDEVKERIKNDDRYRSVTDFVRVAIREKLNPTPKWEDLNSTINEMKTSMVKMAEAIAVLKKEKK